MNDYGYSMSKLEKWFWSSGLGRLVFGLFWLGMLAAGIGAVCAGIVEIVDGDYGEGVVLLLGGGVFLFCLWYARRDD